MSRTPILDEVSTIIGDVVPFLLKYALLLIVLYVAWATVMTFKYKADMAAYLDWVDTAESHVRTIEWCNETPLSTPDGEKCYRKLPFDNYRKEYR